MNESDIKLEQALSQLPKEIEPRRDLWLGIEHAIAKPRKPAYLQPLGLIAASVALVAIILLARPTFNPAGATGYEQNMQSIALTLSKGFEQDKQSLLQHYANQPSFTPDWQLQLQDMDESKELILHALAEDPNNPALLQLLQQVYREQLYLIQKVHPNTRYTSI